MGMLAAMSFFQCGLAPQNVTDRLSYLLALLFAVIAFQIIIGETIPFVPYLTIVDKYNLSILLLIMVHMVGVITVGGREEGLFVENSDIDWMYNVGILYPYSPRIVLTVAIIHIAEGVNNFYFI